LRTATRSNGTNVLQNGRYHERRHDELYVVACVFNPRRFESRVRLFHEFENYVAASGAKLFVVEAAFGDRRHEVTSPTNPMHLQVRTNVELWHKERLASHSRVARSIMLLAVGTACADESSPPRAQRITTLLPSTMRMRVFDIVRGTLRTVIHDVKHCNLLRITQQLKTPSMFHP